MLQLSFKQTRSELIVRAAATVLFNTLSRSGVKLVSISDLTEGPQYGFTASAATQPVGPKFVRITDLQGGRINWDSVPYCKCDEPDKYLLRDDDLLFARTGATTGKTHLVRNPSRSVFASYLIRLRPKPAVFAGYLHGFFQSDNYWSQISEGKEGSAQPNVNGAKLAALQVPLVDFELQCAIAEFLRCVRSREDGERVELPQLPSPLAEQRPIVARIEELASQIHEAQEIKSQTKRKTDSFWKSLSRQARETSYSPRQLNDMADFLDDLRVPLSETQRSLRKGMFPYYGASGIIDYIDSYRFDEPLLLLSEDGANLVNRSTPIAFIATGKYWVNNHAHVLRPRAGVADLRFLAYALADYDVSAFNFASAQPKLNQKNAKQIEFPLPPHAEQLRIVADLEAVETEVESLKRLQAETAAELDALLPAILDRAFRGEL